MSLHSVGASASGKLTIKVNIDPSANNKQREADFHKCETKLWTLPGASFEGGDFFDHVSGHTRARAVTRKPDSNMRQL